MSKSGMVLVKASLIIAVVAIQGATLSALAADTVYVATDGDNSNPGTIDRPYLTIAKCLSVMVAGDTCLIRGGTYSDTEMGFTTTLPSGTSWADAITVKAYPAETVIIAPGYGEAILGPAHGEGYQIWENIIFDAKGVQFAIGGNGAPHHFRFLNCEVKNATRSGILPGRASFYEFIDIHSHHNGSDTGDHGIYMTGTDNLIEGGLWHDNAGYGIHIYDQGQSTVSRNTVRNARIFDNRSGGLIMTSGDDNVAHNNLIYGNARTGASISESDASARSGLYNNTIFGNGGFGLLVGAGSVDAEVRDNVVYSNGAKIPINQGGIIEASGAGIVNLGAYTAILGNTIYNNNGIGIFLPGDSRSATVTGNMAYLNYFDIVDRGDRTVLENNAWTDPEPVQSGRFFTEMQQGVRTGFAIANRNSQPAELNFSLTDADGGDLYSGTVSIPVSDQYVSFLNEYPFAPPVSLGIDLSRARTVTFSSALPLKVTALRQSANERGELHISTLPITELRSVPGFLGRPTPSAFPQYADGGGWRTEVLLVNPSNSPIAGIVHFITPGTPTTPGSPATLSINNELTENSAYNIAGGSAMTLRTSGAGGSTTAGWIRVIPSMGVTPSSALVLSYRENDVTVSETVIASMPDGSSFDTYAEMSGDLGRGELGAAQTALALCNSADRPALIRLELLTLDGAPTGLRGTLTVPANGNMALFLNQVPGFEDLSAPFKGLLRMSGPLTAVVAMRAEYNRRGEFVLTATPTRLQ